MYGSSAPPPPPLMNGSIPSTRLQTQPQPEMPSCVQNAMMTKDKKPFTYTPGGIDLSQIKSPRMAQRINRNAHMEGVSNQPKPSQFAQQSNYPNAPRSPPASAMGLPVQVFPSGPPPPPPAPSKSQLNANVPNANRSPSLPRKSNQTFEPPPMGCRPEIKIPENPMAILRKVPTPKEKNDYWIEEYKKERSKSPMPGTDQNVTNDSEQIPQTVQEFESNYPNMKQSADKVDSPVPSNASSNTNMSNSHQSKMDNSMIDQNNNFNYTVNNTANNFNNANQNSTTSSPQQRIDSPYAASPQPMNVQKPTSPVKIEQQENFPIYIRSSQRAASEKPQAPQPPMNTLSRQSSLEQGQTPIYQRTQHDFTASPINNQSNQSQSESYPIHVRSFQKQQAPQPPKSFEPKPSTLTQQYNTEPGRQYYQPNRVTSPSVVANESQQTALANQSMPPWMQRKTNTKEIPEWANNSTNNFASNNQTTTQSNNNFQQLNSTNQQNNYPTNGNNNYSTNTNNNQNMNGAGLKERIVPIQFEQSPTKNVTSPPFTAQPYQNMPPQYNRVQPPPFAPTATNYAATYNDPNKFVDQGYNNVREWDLQQQQQRRVISPTGPSTNQNGPRVIPIKLEDGHPYLSGPISQTPHVIQSDSRSTPNQSKSFRVLQQITDTMQLDPAEMAELSKPAELQQPQYGRPLGPNDMNEHQLRKLNLNDQPQSQKHQTPFEARFQQQFPDWVPSKQPSFNVIQSMTKSDRDGIGYTDL